MTDTPLIRRVVAADRGQRRKHRHFVSVSTETVIECVGEMPDQWTTRDVAEKLGVSERAVRTAVQWLSDNKLIRTTATKERKTAARKSAYQVTVYEIAPVNDCDCALLNRIFMGMVNG